jgi:signal transduction histidine kinase
MAARPDSDVGSPDRTVRRAVVALAVGAIIAFVIVVVGATILAKQIARNEELAEATRTGNVLVHTELAGAIQALVDGDPEASAALDEAVQIRRRSGSTVYLMILSPDGHVYYPPGNPETYATAEEEADQRKFQPAAPLPAEASATLIAAQEGRAEIGDHAVGRMVKVDVPVELPNGTAVKVLVYSTDERLATAESALSVKLVGLSAGAVSLLFVLNLPVSIWLLRRVGKAHLERVRLLSNEVAAADRERRNIARDLHDGVIQDLAGAGYALEALTAEFEAHADESTRRMLNLSHDAVQRSTQALRTLIVEVAPPDLTSEKLPMAIEELAGRLGSDHHVDVEVVVDLGDSIGQQVVAIVYRTVRECLTNIGKHARAKHARITIRSDASNVYVVAEDDGKGFPADMAERRRNGHVGLTLLAGTIIDLGGSLTIDDRGQRGAAVRCRIPIG